LGIRDRQRGFWLVIAVLAGVIVVVIAISFDRATPPPGAAVPDAATDSAIDPAADTAVPDPAPDNAAPEPTPAP
jgi:hypothetical protein